MIQGKKRQEVISLNDLYSLTSGGKDVYIKYMGRIPKGAIKRPWGEDNHPSFGIWEAPDGVWMWKDQAKEQVGGAVQFVQKLFNLSYGEAMQKICFDLGLEGKEVPADRVYVTSVRKDPEYVHITARTMRFNKRHHAFWNAVGVSEDWCKKFDCYAVKELAINRRKVRMGENEIVFVYLARDINKVKVYFPDREDGARFRTNAPFHYLWQAEKATPGRLVIHKSMKDLITFAQIFPNNIATQNESVKLFTPEVVQRINDTSQDVWLFYGSDEDGVKKSTEVLKSTGWKYINTPRNMLPEINDVYSYVKKHGINKLEQFCKSKNLI